MKTIYFDLETTGLDYNENRIVEIAMLYEDEDIGNKSKAIFHQYIYYDTYPDDYDQIVHEVTGLNKEFLKEHGQPEQNAYNDLIVFLNERVDQFDKSDKILLCGYNVNFDDQFLRNMFKRFQNNYYGSYFLNIRLDIMSLIAMARKHNIIPVLANWKLETVAKYAKVESQAHSALEDAKTTRKLYLFLEEQFKNWREKI